MEPLVFAFSFTASSPAQPEIWLGEHVDGQSTLSTTQLVAFQPENPEASAFAGMDLTVRFAMMPEDDQRPEQRAFVEVPLYGGPHWIGTRRYMQSILFAPIGSQVDFAVEYQRAGIVISALSARGWALVLVRAATEVARPSAGLRPFHAAGEVKRRWFACAW